MVYGSICSGIEAASVAWSPLGFKPAFFSEIEAFPRGVLSHHYPSVPLRGDFREIEGKEHGSIDILVGGTPCQSFSIAGKRKGLDDPRGELALEYIRLVKRTVPRWLVWENVPGVLNSGGGRDFGAFVGALAQCGYGWAYRILDAQFCRVDGFPYAVPQRRRRVFLVGHSGGDWRRAASVLFDSEGGGGNPPTRRSPGEETAGIPEDCPSSDNRRGLEGTGLAIHQSQEGSVRLSPVSYCLKTGGGTVGQGYQATIEELDRKVSHDPACTILANQAKGTPRPESSHNTVVVEAFNTRQDPLIYGEISGPLDFHPTGSVGVFRDQRVRRLTPKECERLQGFPDEYTQIPWKGKPPHLCPDGPRLRAIGNSMAVNVVRWIGQRIQMVDRL